MERLSAETAHAVEVCKTLKAEKKKLAHEVIISEMSTVTWS
mgnify:CR=1 FL=1